MTKQAFVSNVSYRNYKLFCNSSARDFQNSAQCAYYVQCSREVSEDCFLHLFLKWPCSMRCFMTSTKNVMKKLKVHCTELPEVASLIMCALLNPSTQGKKEYKTVISVQAPICFNVLQF